MTMLCETLNKAVCLVRTTALKMHIGIVWLVVRAQGKMVKLQLDVWLGQMKKGEIGNEVKKKANVKWTIIITILE